MIATDRGGETTYHGPGQLVVYPIISIRQLNIGPVAYVRLLEEVTLQVLSDHGICGHRVVGKTGVWVGGEPGDKVAEGEAPLGRKIAAIGVRISGGIAMHGTALNVHNGHFDIQRHSALWNAGIGRHLNGNRTWTRAVN